MTAAALGLVLFLAALAILAGALCVMDAAMAYRARCAHREFREQVLIAQAHVEAFRRG